MADVVLQEIPIWSIEAVVILLNRTVATLDLQ